MKKKQIRNFLRQVSKLEKQKGGFSHNNGWADVYHPSYYPDEKIERLKEIARKLLQEDD